MAFGEQCVSTPRDQHRADQIFTDALDRPPASRSSFIDTACGEDEPLRAEVQDLLDHYASAEDALTQSRTTHRFSGRPELDQVDLKTDTGRTVGVCRLDSRLPDDGLFERWSTRRDAHQPPAILALARQKLSVDESRRVAMHAEFLLRLDHPGLPRVLEAGTVDLGRGPEAFFLIEQAAGDPVSDAPARHVSELRKRLHGFQNLCEAVQELHFRGLIHGQLLASRLVMDDAGMIRPMDPGMLATLARAVSDSAAAEAMRSTNGAPERPVLASQDLDARIDIYDLGVLLQQWCEGLSGTLPEQVHEIAQQATSHDREARQRAAGELGDSIRRLLQPAAQKHEEGPHGVGLSPSTVATLVAAAAAAAFAIGALVF